jgi:hypothetical protein
MSNITVSFLAFKKRSMVFSAMFCITFWNHLKQVEIIIFIEKARLSFAMKGCVTFHESLYQTEKKSHNMSLTFLYGASFLFVVVYALFKRTRVFGKDQGFTFSV